MKTEEFVLQRAEPYDHDYIEVELENASYRASSYMNDVGHYDSLKLAELAVKALHTRFDFPVRIIRIGLEEVEVIVKA